MHAVSTESSYKSVDRLIFSKGKNLWIISPFVSERYLEILKRVSSRKKVYLITSNSSYEKAVAIAGKNLGRPKVAHLAAVMAVAGLLVLAKQYLFSLVMVDIIGAWLSFFAMAMALPKRKSNMQVRMVRGNFVHEKIYIGDSYAITGSANLTYSGMHKNTERIELVDDKKEFGELKRHFIEMWKRAS